MWSREVKYRLVSVFVAMGTGLATGSPTLGQNGAGGAEAAAASVEDRSSQGYDAGVSVQIPTAEFLGGRYGGWFTVGQGGIRISVDYWQERLGGSEFRRAFGKEGSEFSESLWAAITKHFRLGRRFRPHLSFGSGYLRSNSVTCTGRPEPGSVECHRGGGVGVVIVMAVGSDVSFGSRFFARIQSRGYSIVGSEYQLEQVAWSMATYVFVGGGMRF